jgi:aryl-alcohol dehydrogenase-like predicted oxidoreductase
MTSMPVRSLGLSQPVSGGWQFFDSLHLTTIGISFMHQRKLGPFQVSAIGLGCMNMSSGYGPADKRESVRLLNDCIDRGYNFLDTASLYGDGHNEQLIGDTLHHRRDEFVLASKCGISRKPEGGYKMDGRPEVIQKTCEDSLRRLQTEVIDLYYLHRPDPDTPIEESVGALADLVAQGKIKTIGLSEMCAETTYRAQAVHPITAMQSEYSLWSRTPERKILSVCEELDITLVAFSPVARSFLTGTTSNVDQIDKDDIRATAARPRFEVENFNKNLKLLGPYKEIAAQQNCTMAQLALAWLLARGDRKIIPIPGTKNVSHMKENAGAGDIELSDAVVQSLDALINESTVAGRRYIDSMMASSDAEKD